MAERRPYLGLKDSQLTFWQERTRSLQDSASAESEFEKPYLDGDYRKMHYDPSVPDWSSKPILSEPRVYPPLCCYTTGKILGVLFGYDNGVLTVPTEFIPYTGTRYVVLVNTYWGPKQMVCCSSDFVHYLVGDVVLLLLLGFVTFNLDTSEYITTRGACFTDCPETCSQVWCQEGNKGKPRPYKIYFGANTVDGVYLIVPLTNDLLLGQHWWL